MPSEFVWISRRPLEAGRAHQCLGELRRSYLGALGRALRSPGELQSALESPGELWSAQESPREFWRAPDSSPEHQAVQHQRASEGCDERWR
eukprot:389979-Alexandrium_andersonii.AAC.1